MFIVMFLNIVQSNVHSIYNSALTVSFTPVLQNQEKQHSPPPSKRLGAATRSLRVVLVSDCVFQFESIFVGSVIADLLGSK